MLSADRIALSPKSASRAPQATKDILLVPVGELRLAAERSTMQ